MEIYVVVFSVMTQTIKYYALQMSMEHYLEKTWTFECQMVLI